MSSLRAWLRPGLLGLHVLAVVGLVFCITMGLWQLGVYDSRQDDERADQRDVPRVELAGLWGPDDAFEARLAQRPVTAEGTFASDADQFWVTGREQDGVQGVWLVAPLMTQANSALLVVRGWAPEPGDAPPLPSGRVSVEAALQQGEGGGTPWNPDTREIGSVRIPAMTNELPYDLYSGFAIATGSDADLMGGLTPAQTPDLSVSWTVGLKNLAYTLQWWVFGLFVVFMWWRMCHEQLDRRVADDDRTPSSVSV